MEREAELDRERRRALTIIAILAPIALATYVTRMFVLKQYRVPTGAMIPTIHSGDRVFVNKLAYAFGETPKSGDVVAFRSPHDATHMLKRVVAGPGDTIEMRDNVVFVNGERRHEPYILLTPDISAMRTFSPQEIPPGHYFVMGDNRDNSNDSRYLGTVAEDRMIGRMFHVLHIGRCEEQ